MGPPMNPLRAPLCERLCFSTRQPGGAADPSVAMSAEHFVTSPANSMRWPTVSRTARSLVGFEPETFDRSHDEPLFHVPYSAAEASKAKPEARSVQAE